MNDNLRQLSRRAYWSGGESLASILMAKSLEHPELVSLAAAFIDNETLPVEAVRQAVDSVFADTCRARAALQYGTTMGFLPLRKMLLERMLDADGQTIEETGLSAEQVLITTGSNTALYLLADTLLNPGDIILCGSPSYFVFMGTLANLGARAVGVEMDAEGMVPESLEARLDYFQQHGELDRVKAIYVISYFDNPTGVTLSTRRRQQLIEIARRRSRDVKIRILEDAAYRELRYEGDDVRSIRSFDENGGTVAVAGSFSKTFAPGVRVGWAILPQDLVAPVAAQKANLDFGSPNFSQYLMYSILKEGLFDSHLLKIREKYGQKLTAILDAMDEHLSEIEGVSWIQPQGGLYVWLTMPEHVDTSHGGRLFDLAVNEGVLYVPGDHCYPTGIPPLDVNGGDTDVPINASGGRACPYEYPRVPKNTIRLSFGVPPCDEIRRGIAALGRAMKQVC